MQYGVSWQNVRRFRGHILLGIGLEMVYELIMDEHKHNAVPVDVSASFSVVHNVMKLANSLLNRKLWKWFNA